MKAFGEDSWRPKAANLNFVATHSGTSFSNNSKKIQFERASKNQCKKITNFEAKRDPEMMSKLVGKSNIFLNGPRWVVFRRSTFY